ISRSSDAWLAPCAARGTRDCGSDTSSRSMGPRRRGDPVTSSVGRRPLLPRPAAGEAVEAMPRAAVDEPANRAEDRPFDRQRGEKERPAHLAMLGLGGLLVGDEPPDGVEELLRDRAGEDAAEDAEGEEEDLHDRVRRLGRPLLLW